MKPLAILCTLLIIAGLTPACFAQPALEWKLKKGEVFWVKQSRQTTQKLDVQDSIIRQELKATNLSRFEVVQITGGNLILKQKIESITASNGKDNPAVKDLLSRLTGATLTFHLNGHYQIAKVEGYDALIKKMAKVDDALEKTARLVLPETELRDTVEQLFEFVPKKPPQKGDTWESASVESFGPLGVLKITNQWSWTDKAQEQDVARIVSQQKIKLDTSGAGKGLPFQVKAGVVKESKGKVTIDFDLARSRLQKRTLNRQLQVHFLINKDGRNLDMRIEQDTSATLEVLDKKPAAGPKVKN